MKQRRVKENATTGRLHTQPTFTRRSYVATIAGISVATAGCLHSFIGDPEGADSTSDWPTVRGDLARSARAPADAGPGGTLSVAWKSDPERIVSVIAAIEPSQITHSWITAADPVLSANNCIVNVHYRYIGTDTGLQRGTSLVSLSQRDGSPVWEYSYPGNDLDREPTRLGSPQVEDGFVYAVTPEFRSEDRAVNILDAESGEQIARFELDGTFFPAAFQDRTLYGSDRENGQILAIDLEDGSLMWQRNRPNSVPPFYLPAIASETLFYAGPSTGLVARDLGSGEQRWRREDIGDGPVMINDDVGFVTSGFYSKLIAFEPDSGSTRWEFEPDTVEVPPDDEEEPNNFRRLWQLPVVVDSLVLVTGTGEPTGSDDSDFGSYLYAFDRDDGTQEWTLSVEYPLLNGWFGSLVAAGDRIYHHNEVISTAGERLDSFDSEYSLLGHPAIGGGRLFTQHGEGVVALE